MRNVIGIAIVAILAGSVHAEPDGPRVASAITTPFITGYTLTQSRVAELGSLGRLWDGYRMNIVRGDIGESIAERAFFGGPELAQSKKGSWVSIAPRYGNKGIDHVFLRVDKNGLPNNLIIGESKYGNSRRGKTKDGKQMGYRWRTERLKGIGDRYSRFAKSSDPIIRAKDIPIGAKSMDIYFSKTHKVTVWEKGGKWYTDAEEITDARLRTRATTYGRYFSDAGAGLIRTRNFLFRIKERSTGDYLVKISKLSDEGEITATRNVLIPKEFVAQGRVDTKVLKAALKRKHPSWSDARIAREANDIKRVVSNKEFLDPANARKQAIKEINKSSIASAGIAGAFSLVFQLGAEAWEHGADFKSYDLEGISMSTVKGAAVAGVASYVGQRTALHLAGKEILSRQISSKAAGRIGGGIGAAIVLAESFGGCVMGNKNWKDGSIEAGIGAVSMVAGHFAATGVSALIGSAAAGAAATAGTVAAGTAAAAGTTATAGVGVAGTATTVGVAGTSAGATGSGGLMATAAAAGPVIAVAAAAIAAAAVVSYGGYAVYEHYKNIELVKGEFTFNEKKVDILFDDDERYDRSIDRMLGF